MRTVSASRPLAQKAATLARQIMTVSKLNFQQAQSKAYYTFRLMAAMQKGPVEFAYIKDDNSYRWARGEQPDPAYNKPHIIRYLDTDASAIRSFRIDRLVVI